MKPLSGLVLFVLCVLVFTASRRGALLALLAGVLFISQTQGIYLVGFNLFPSRVLEIVLVARVMSRREWSSLTFNAIDKAIVWLYAFTTVVYCIRSSDGIAYQIGQAVDAFLVYFCCRALIGSPEDFYWLLRSFVLLLIPYVPIVVVEHLRGPSPLAFLGWGFSEVWLREGKVRCFGSFRHPSLLGTISVAFIPLFIGMALRPRFRRMAVLGLVLCLIIVWTANSGGPISGVAFGCLAWAFWRLRLKMRAVRWGIVAFVTAAAILMKAPVWYLIAHVSQITGGDGWHRAYLMDVSFQNLGKWWFAGMRIQDTVNWFEYDLSATNGADITNEFIGFGITAGLGAMALFILLLTRAFSALGKALDAVRAASPEPSEPEFLLWSLGAVLAAHIVNWLGITYFDQTYVFWFLQLAAISSLTDWYVKSPPQPAPAAQPEEADSEFEDLMETAAQ